MAFFRASIGGGGASNFVYKEFQNVTYASPATFTVDFVPRFIMIEVDTGQYQGYHIHDEWYSRTAKNIGYWNNVQSTAELVSYNNGTVTVRVYNSANWNTNTTKVYVVGAQ